MFRNLFWLAVLGAAGVVACSQHAATPLAKSAECAPRDSADRVGIAALHHADSVATISGRPEDLALLWDSAAVRMEQGSPATVTKAAIYASDSSFRATHPGSGIVSYAPHIEGSVQRCDIAIEWGYFDSEYRSKPTDRAEHFRANILRGLRRQADGSWKFSHVMWNLAG